MLILSINALRSMKFICEKTGKTSFQKKKFACQNAPNVCFSIHFLGYVKDERVANRELAACKLNNQLLQMNMGNLLSYVAVGVYHLVYYEHLIKSPRVPTHATSYFNLEM